MYIKSWGISLLSPVFKEKPSITSKSYNLVILIQKYRRQLIYLVYKFII